MRHKQTLNRECKNGFAKIGGGYGVRLVKEELEVGWCGSVSEAGE
jgi:hypothetical protein